MAGFAVMHNLTPIEGLDGDPLPPRQGTEVAFSFFWMMIFRKTGVRSRRSRGKHVSDSDYAAVLG
jgi:hypothetical protein